MNDGPSGPLLVDLVLAGAWISGLTNRVENRRRLVDVLNGEGELLDLEEATVNYDRDRHPRSYHTLSVDKSSIVVAIPRETQEQTRRRALLTSTVGRSATVQTPVAILIPPFRIEGMAHLTPGSGKVRPDPSVFSRFFPLTIARIELEDGSFHEASVALVNRDAIVAMSLLSDGLPYERQKSA
ncbi:MAG TPA: hypothetical protein VI759_05560 [Dehalococcoidia bacterium]|nr:hypothetical protein [Dehalococcoidia bacterium]